MLSRWIYILIGNNNTGKTTFQKRLVYHLCGIERKKLNTNLEFPITHPYAPKKLENLFTISRSYQELSKYKTISNYFENYFISSDVCILSSHAHRENIPDIEEMIYEGRNRFYNVGAVFFSNAKYIEEFKHLDWDEVFLLNNPKTSREEKISQQIDSLSWEFSEMIIRRAMQQ